MDFSPLDDSLLGIVSSQLVGVHFLSSRSIFLFHFLKHPGSAIFRNVPTQFGGALVASARSWSHAGNFISFCILQSIDFYQLGLFPADPAEALGAPLRPSARSWAPSSGPLVFPTSGPKTNAGQLAYQREDALRAAAANSRPPPPPPPQPSRPAKAIHFPPERPNSNSGHHQLQASASEFRPSPPIPFDEPFDVAPQPLKRESAATTSRPSKSSADAPITE